MVYEEQLYLLSCIFASRADIEKVKSLSNRFKDSLDFINAIIVLWPEYDDPINLKFLFDTNEKCNESDESLVVSLIDGDSDLISMVELDNSDISDRLNRIKLYIERELQSLTLNGKEETNWLIKRILFCNEHIPEDTLFYSQLWDKIDIKDNDFQDWLDSIVLPLSNINERIGMSLKIKEFFDMEPNEIFNLVSNNNIINVEILDELLPYMSYKDDEVIYELFLNKYYKKDQFPLDSMDNIRTLTKLFNSLKENLKSQNQKLLFEKTLGMVFLNSTHFLNTDMISSLQEILKEIPDTVELVTYPGISSKLLIEYFNSMKSLLQNLNLFDIYTISEEDEASQMSHFSTICNEGILADDSYVEKLRHFINEEQKKENSQSRVFNKLNSEQELSILYETILSLGKFSILSDFSSDLKDKTFENMEIALLEKYFWQFFNSETNGNVKRPGMIKCSKVLQLLQEKSSTKSYANLEMLLDISNELTKYSMSLGKGVIFKPCNILDFKEDPFKIIAILLERNPGLYKSLDKTYSILEKLFVALDRHMTDIDKENGIEYGKLISMHIDYSLASLDFQYAMNKSQELIKRKNLVPEFWYSVLQVAKFRDPNWVDNKTPTEILFMQMHLLSQLLQVCSVEDVEVVTQQWSELEIEIASRDLVHDKYSLEQLNTKNTVFSTLFA